MYSREVRMKAQNLGNPNLGPGCYTQDEQLYPAGDTTKAMGEETYAPFSSLSKRVSAFDEMARIGNQAPGMIYDTTSTKLARHNTDAAAMFGRSRTRRFHSDTSDTPGPGKYSIKGFQPKYQPGKKSNRVYKGAQLNVMKREIDAVVNLTHAPSSSVPKRQDPRKNSVLGGQELTGVSVAPTNETGLHKSDKRITWKRKYLPPSIPMGDNTYGYMEGQHGELVPRKPPTRRPDPLAYNLAFSFVERAKHHGKGFKFGNSKTGLKFQVNEGPGPSDYATSIEPKGVSGAVMTLSPCVRLTDVVIRNELKYGVPGPGSYEMESPIDLKLKKTQGSGVEKRKVAANDRLLLANDDGAPGPGSYQIADSAIKPPSLRNVKNRPFGQTTSRFENERNKTHIPAPGAYKVESDLIVNKPYRGVKSKPFGSYTERFPGERINEDPGPGAYETGKSTYNSLGFSTYNYLHHFTPKKNRNPGFAGVSIVPRNPRAGEDAKDEEPKDFIVRKGKLKILVGDNEMANNTRAHVPVFGSQGERFHQSQLARNPPPDSYDTANSFQKIKNHGKVAVGLRLGMSRRDLFSAKNQVPGPGSYEGAPGALNLAPRGNMHFLSTENRFEEKFQEQKPAPNEYMGAGYDKSLLKKTFNIALGMNERRRLKIMN